ncbi:MAG TPA: phosphotransferase [Arachnia sp.]|nr:phosphotransferase [Arachnia sp.]HMT87335.1 phosphotransferase [Arachnia sp.]
MKDEKVLTGGNATESVVRVGSTVRKPWTLATPSVRAFMDAIRGAGVTVPETYGRDEQGRLVLEYIPGALATDAPLSSAELRRVGEMVRAIHDAADAFVSQADDVWDTAIPAPGADLVCHNDLAPWNLIVGERWVFIDWDSSAPSTRLWDLAYSAQAFTLNDPSAEPGDAARGLRAFIEGYRADRTLREQLPRAMARRAEAMFRLLQTSHETGREPWASMYADGHGAHWRAATQYVTLCEEYWRQGLLSP